MTTNVVLKNIADVLRAETVKMLTPKADSQVGDDSALVAPAVTPGYAPPRDSEMSEYGSGYHAPCIVVGLGDEGGSDDGREASVPVRVLVGTYSPGEMDENGMAVLNNSGFIDLINLMDLVREILLKRTVLRHTTVQRPMSWGLYPDQPYPYWYGWISFDAGVAVVPALDIADNNFLTL